MKHYKIVKRGTIFSIALATLAVFLQLGLAIYTLNSTPAKAELPAVTADSCMTSTPADLYFVYNTKLLSVNMVSKYANVSYHYEMKLKSNSAGQVLDSREGDVGENTFPPLISFDIQTFSYFSSLDLVVNYTSNVFLGVQDCKSSFTQTISPFTGVAGTTALDVTPNSIDLATDPSASFQIHYKFDNAGASYSLSITDCAGKESVKKGGDRGTGFKEETFEWTPSETISCSHEIILRGLDTTGQEIMSNTKRQTVTVSGNTTISDPNAGKLDPGSITFQNKTYKLGGIDVKLASIGTGFGPVVDLVENILVYLVGLLALVGIVYGGIMYITAGGDDAKAEKAKKTILYSIVGIILAVLSVTIVAIIAKFPNI